MAAAGLRRPPRRHHRHRVRPGLPRPARRLAGGVRAGRRRPRGAVDAPRRARRHDRRRAGPCMVVNPLSWARDGITTGAARLPAPGRRGVSRRRRRRRGAGGDRRGCRGTPTARMAEITLSVPGRGRAGAGLPGVPRSVDGAAAAGRVDGRGPARPRSTTTPSRVDADPARGGALCRIVDRRTGRELLRPGGLGGELVVQEEYAEAPASARGPGTCCRRARAPASARRSAEVRVEHSPLGSRLVTVADARRAADHPRGACCGDGRRPARLPHPRRRLDRAATGCCGSASPSTCPARCRCREVGFAVDRPRRSASPRSTPPSTCGRWTTRRTPGPGSPPTARIALHDPDGGSPAHAIGVAEVIASGRPPTATAAPARRAGRARASPRPARIPDGPALRRAGRRLQPARRPHRGRRGQRVRRRGAGRAPGRGLPRRRWPRTGRVFVPAARPRARGVGARTPTCAARATCRCSSWPAPTPGALTR